MNSWEDFILLITNPYFIGLFLITLAIEPILKFIRRFYSESHKKAVEESENFIKELQNNKEDKKLYNKANLKIGLFIFGPTLLLFAIYIAYNFLIGAELKPQSIKETFAKFATISIITLGLYGIKSDKINKWLFKDDYQRVTELTYKQSGGEAFYKYYEKYFPIAGYFFLSIGIFGFINMLFFD
ncbi:MAG: hypothetical protein ABFR02_01415 [Campylobacterota bacterium]